MKRFKLIVFNILILCLVYPNFLTSQNKQEQEFISQEFQKLDSIIKLKEYDIALNGLEKLEKQNVFKRNKKNHLELQLKKASIFYEIENKEKAISILLKGIDILKAKPDWIALKFSYAVALANYFKEEHNYSKSRSYYLLFLKDLVEKKDTTKIIDIYIHLGNTYYLERINDSAKYYYTKAISFPLNSSNTKLISNAFNNLSLIAYRKKEYNLAEEYGNKSFKIIKQQQDTLAIAATLINMSNVLYPKKEYKRIRDNYLKAIAYIENFKSKKALNIKYIALSNLSFVYEELNDYKKAYHYLEQANSLKEELDKKVIAQNISEIEAKYNVAKEAQKVEEEKSKRLRTQIWLYGSAIGFITMFVVIYIFYRNYRLKQQSKLEQLENELQTKIINATIDAKEKERKSIAETLHDSVSALLSSANLHLQATKAKLNDNTPNEVNQAQDIVNEASVKIRDLSHELISSVLLKFGLAFAVHDMCQKYSNSQISFHSDESGIKRYDQDFEIKIHNIIEELVNNILKHSKATQATIMLAHRKDDKLSIRITDDGVGFEMENVKGKDGLGLSHINARIKVMKGVFNIVSSSEDGTNVFILVPIEFKKVEIL